MSHAIGKILLWLALLALPLHGIAGAGVGLCHAMHAPEAAAMQASATDCDSMPAEAASKATADKCSVPGSCAVTAAITLPVAAAFVPLDAGTFDIVIPQPDFGFLTGAPERPPRAFS